ncbi:MAG: DUF3794 domain-containing protein [Firmicutes bacterium]|nr:DUF3794 domain-containing protein [Bacillota bacterium]
MLFTGLWQFHVIMLAVALFLLGFFIIRYNKHGRKILSGAYKSRDIKHGNRREPDRCDNSIFMITPDPELVNPGVTLVKRNLTLCTASSWGIGNATRMAEDTEPPFDDPTSCPDSTIGSPGGDATNSQNNEGYIIITQNNPGPSLPVQNEERDEGRTPGRARPIFLNCLIEKQSRLGEGGLHMLNMERYSQVQTACLKVEKVIGHGSKQVLLEETITIPGIKIVEITPVLTNIRSIVKDSKVIIQGTVHKQIFYIGTDELEHHLAEDIDFSELVDVDPVNPTCPVREGMNHQDFSVIENNVFEFDPDSGTLTQKIILKLCVKVTETEQFSAAVCPEGTLIKTKVVVGENVKQKFIEETKVIPAIKVIEIVPRISQIKHIVKDGKVLVQGIVHKQIFYVGTDDLVHHLSEDIPFSDLLVVPCAREGMDSQDHSFVDNLVFEFDSATGILTQKIILVLCVGVTETCGVPVRVCESGTLIKSDRIIGFGCAQKLVEETRVLPAIKIVDIDAQISEITSIVKNGKVIVQGVVHKQIFFVGTDDLVHHIAEDIPFSEMIEIPPINPGCPVEEGMDQQDRSFVENIVWEFDPATGELTEKVIVFIETVVTEHVQIPIVPADPCVSIED